MPSSIQAPSGLWVWTNLQAYRAVGLVKGQSLGLQTMVCIPWANGVVELGSTDAIFHCEDQMDLIKKVRVLFNSNSLQMSSLPITEQGKSDHNLRSVLATTNNLHAKDMDNISNIIARSGKRTL